MKLTMKTKPKSLTLGQIYEIYCMDTGVETSDLVIKVLDLCYPKLNKESLSGTELRTLSKNSLLACGYGEFKLLFSRWSA
jgi:hypothetical protein